MLALAVVVVFVSSPSLVVPARDGAPQFASVPAARDLTYSLERAGLNAIATHDPSAPGTFVAAIYVGRHTLLAISARHPSADDIQRLLRAKKFAEAYTALVASPILEGKFAVRDSAADGILSALPGSGAFDVVEEDGSRRTLFDGDVEGQKLTAAQYDARRAAADARYTHILRLLVSAAQAA